MTDPIAVRLHDRVGPICAATDDAQSIYDEIFPILADDRPVVLVFDGVEVLIPAFLNVAVGQLFGAMPEEKIRALVSVSGIADDDRELFEAAMENAKRYWERPADYDRAWREEAGIEESHD